MSRLSILLVVAAALAPQAANAATVAHYRFENGTAVDETGVNNGTLVGSPAFSSSVGQNPVNETNASNTQSLALNGTAAQYVTAPHNASLSFGSNPWTIEAYVNLSVLPTTATAGQWLVQKKDVEIDDFQEYGFLVGGNRAGLFGSLGNTGDVTGAELRVELGNLVGGFTGITSNLVIPSANQWYFVSAAYDGSTSIRFTLDDNLNDNLPGQVETITFGPLANRTDDGSLILGAKFNNAGTGAQNFNGLIDEIRISSGIVPLGNLLTVPEPSTWALAVMAAFGLAVIRRHKGA